MKLFTIAALLLLLSSCGLQNQIDNLRSRQNRDDVTNKEQNLRLNALEANMQAAEEQLMLLGMSMTDQQISLQTQINSINEQITALSESNTATQSQLDELESTVQGTMNSISVLQGQVSAIQGDTALFQVNLTNVQTSLVSLYSSLSTQSTSATTTLQSLNTAVSGLQSTVTTLQGQINSALVNIATLQGYNNIVQIKDPCGAQGSYNEVLLKLSNGKYLSSYSENSGGLNTRFAILADGTYRTTDGSGCYFTVSNGGTVISNEHN